jgi:predicted MPP superfamily phosphohydrolase
VRRCNALKPDLVAVTGDLVDGSVTDLGPHVAALRNLGSRFGTFFITGNHEYYSGDEEWCTALEGMGLTVLRNRHVTLGDAGGQLDLVGVDDWSAGVERGRRAYDLDRALAGRNKDRAAVLLAHQPRDFEKAVQNGIGLQLSGHTHGGQLFPGTLFIPMLWPRPAGHFTLGDGHLYVSRGTGFWGPPMRVGAPPEIVKVVLRSA